MQSETTELLTNGVRPRAWLPPRGCVTSLYPNQPFCRDYFVRARYGFGCGVYKLSKIVVQHAVVNEDLLRAVREKLATVEEARLWGGGRVGLYLSQTPDGVENFLVVFAGLTETETRAMEEELAEYEREFVQSKTAALATDPFDPHAVFRAVVSNPRVSHFVHVTHKLDEWAFRSQKNRDAIADELAKKFEAGCARTHESVFTQLVWQRDRDRLFLYSDAVPPVPNTYIAYEDPRLPVNVLMRRRRDGEQHEAAACVARLIPGKTITDVRVFGSDRVAFEPIEKSEREKYMMVVDVMLQLICVRVAETDYDDWWGVGDEERLF